MHKRTQFRGPLIFLLSFRNCASQVHNFSSRIDSLTFEESLLEARSKKSASLRVYADFYFNSGNSCFRFKENLYFSVTIRSTVKSQLHSLLFKIHSSFKHIFKAFRSAF